MSLPEPAHAREQPTPETEAAAWWRAHRADLVRLRELGRAWGAQTYNDAMPPTAIERARISLASSAQAPTPTALATLAGIDPRPGALDDAALQARAPHAWMLFDRAVDDLPMILRDALAVVPPLSLALAIRSWDPNLALAGIFDVPRTARELRQLRDRLKDLELDVAELEQLHALAGAKRSAAVRIDAVGLDEEIQRLTAQRDDFESWIAHRSKSSVGETSALEMLRQGERNNSVDKAMRRARVRWWLPVDRALREAGWDEHQLADLILAPGWFADLAPCSRCWYETRGQGRGGAANAPTLRADVEHDRKALRELIRQTRRQRS